MNTLQRINHWETNTSVIMIVYIWSDNNKYVLCCGFVLVTFLIVTKIPEKAELKKACFWLTVWSNIVQHGRDGVTTGAWCDWSHLCPVKEQREINSGTRMSFSFFSFVFNLGPQSKGILLLTFIVGLLTFIKPLLGMLSQTHPKVCLLGDSKLSQAYRGDVLSQTYLVPVRVLTLNAPTLLFTYTLKYR